MDRSIQEIAAELSMSVSDVIIQLNKIGVRTPTEGSMFPENQADQYVHFIRKFTGIGKQLDDPNIPKPTRDVNTVFEELGYTIHAMEGVTGIGIGQDLQGRPFINAYTADPPEKMGHIPKHLEGYAIVMHHTGTVTRAEAAAATADDELDDAPQE